jgi:hypothetical protein
MRPVLPIAAALCAVAAGALMAADRDAPLETSPSRLTLRLGESRQLQARLKGGKSTAVRWTVLGRGNGTITPSGLYQAPTEGQTPATIRILVSIEGDPAAQAETLVTLQPVAVSVKPDSAALAMGQTVQLKADVEGAADQRVRWSVDGGEERGTISPSGVYATPSRFLTPGTVTVRATSAADPSKSSTATLRIGAVTLDLEPQKVKLSHGGTCRFNAKIAGTPNTAVRWSVLGENQGSITDSGLYATPPTMATPTVVTVVATSVADPTKTATARVEVQQVHVSPVEDKERKKKNGLIDLADKGLKFAVKTVSRIYLPFNPVDAVVNGPIFRGKSGKLYVPLGAGVKLTANVSGSTNDRVSWAIEGAPVGRIGEDGFYQAPTSLNTPQVVQVRATSAADPTKTLLYTLNIPPIVVTAPKGEPACPVGGAVQLKATAENTENNRILWTVEGGERNGTVTDTGLYRPADTLTTPAVVRVRAASEADPTKFVLVQVTVPEAGIDLSPSSAEVRPGGSVRLKPKIRGILGRGEVAWSVTPDVGTVTADGLYQAPVDAGGHVVQITATLKSDPTKVATSTVRIKAR